LLQDVTALDESGNSIHGTQINVTALYDKSANQWSEGVKCVNGSMIELSYCSDSSHLRTRSLAWRQHSAGIHFNRMVTLPVTLLPELSSPLNVPDMPVATPRAPQWQRQRFNRAIHEEVT